VERVIAAVGALNEYESFANPSLCSTTALVNIFLGMGSAVGTVAGMGRAALATPAVLERSMIVGAEQAKKEMPQVAKMVGSSAVLFGTVGLAYAGGKCLCESLHGEPHPLNSG